MDFILQGISVTDERSHKPPLVQWIICNSGNMFTWISSSRLALLATLVACGSWSLIFSNHILSTWKGDPSKSISYKWRFYWNSFLSNSNPISLFQHSTFSLDLRKDFFVEGVYASQKWCGSLMVKAVIWYVRYVGFMSKSCHIFLAGYKCGFCQDPLN